MFAKRARLAQFNCSHSSTVGVTNSGIHRSVCEDCGHVSFHATEGLSGSVERSQFEREVEQRSVLIG